MAHSLGGLAMPLKNELLSHVYAHTFLRLCVRLSAMEAADVPAEEQLDSIKKIISQAKGKITQIHQGKNIVLTEHNYV
jgi:hypothetical protein